MIKQKENDCNFVANRCLEKSKEFGKVNFRNWKCIGKWYVKWIIEQKGGDTFAATGNRSLPLPPWRRARLLRSLLDVRYVRIVEVQCERSGHGYGEAGGDHHRRGSSSWISWILARPAVHAIAPSLLLSSASRPLWPPRPWTYIAAHACRLMKTLLPGPYL